jgi:hypothetical protein
MPGEIALGLEVVLELIKILNPSEMEKLKREIRKREEAIAEKKAKLAAALAAGDIDAINNLLFGDE